MFWWDSAPACRASAYAQCETTQNHAYRTGASLLGYTKLYGQVPGGQAEFLGVADGALRAGQGAGRAAG